MEYYLDKITSKNEETLITKVLLGDRERGKYFLISYTCLLNLGIEVLQQFGIRSMNINGFNDSLENFGPEGRTPYYKLVTWNEAKNASPGFAQQLEYLDEFFTNK